MYLPNEIQKLAALMDLTVDTPPAVEINSKSAPRSIIGQLVRQGFIPSHRDTPDNLKWLVEGEGDCNPEPTIHIIDLLGCYRPHEDKVIVYELLVHLCALKMGVDESILHRIVLLHEIAHAVTHRGREPDGSIWDLFAAAEEEKKEYFAQIYTYKQLEREGETAAITAMDALADQQPNLYQTYRSTTAQDVADINASLLEARRQVSTGCEAYSQAISTPWRFQFSNLQRYHEPFVGYILMRAGAKMPEGKLVTSGTEIEIDAKRIKVRSYDYSPAGNTLPPQGISSIFQTLTDSNSVLHSYNFPDPAGPHFLVQLRDGTYNVSMRTPEILDIWRKIVDIVGESYPALARVLHAYEP